MTYRIEEIADIHSGYPFRRSVEHSPEGSFAVIQIRDIMNDRTFDYENLARVRDIQPKHHHLLQKGDLLFIAKGTNNVAVHVTKNLSKTVASANFLIIRIKSERVLPEYLAWYISQRPAQQFFRKHAPGTITPSISKAALSQLPVPIPPLEKQREILRVQSMADAELRLVLQIQAKRAQLIEAVLLNVAEEHTR